MAAVEMEIAEEVVRSQGGEKREREEVEATEENGAIAKKPKPAEAEAEGEKSVEEERLDKEEKKEGDLSVGPKTFDSSVAMFNYFFNLLHFWSTNIDINQYEHMVLLDLLKKGNVDPNKKIGDGIRAFQVRYHPTWKSQCFFFVRVDGSTDDFSYRKCADHIAPLPENMKTESTDGKNGGGHGGGGGHGFRGGRGRGGMQHIGSLIWIRDGSCTRAIDGSGTDLVLLQDLFEGRSRCWV